jgi:hypothetical protein
MIKMRSWRNNLSLMLAAALIAILVCEIGLRAAGVSYPIFTQIDGDVGFSLRPGTEGWWKKEGNTYIRINSAGLRDREHAHAKSAHTLRIAVLGDSYAEALQVPIEDTFWSVLEREIKACPTFAGREPEVINFGVSGYGTAQELITLRHRVWPYSPDIVLLAFLTGNDVYNNSRILEQDEKRPYFVFQNDQLVPDLRFQDSWGFRLRQTETVQAIYRTLNSLRTFQVFSEAKQILTTRGAPLLRYFAHLDAVHAAANIDPGGNAVPWEGYAEAGVSAMVYVEPKDPAWQQAWRVTEGLVVLMRDEAREKAADFLVVTLSNGPQVHPHAAARQAFAKRLGVPHLFYPDFRIRDLGHSERVAVLNLAPPFQTYAEERQVFLHGGIANAGTGHWNKEGHRLAGQLIAEKLCASSTPLQDRMPVRETSSEVPSHRLGINPN